ncbi:hypothetical protein BO86DRAFT_323852, partial [Aspergillus japonicus CBS 114.51]
SLVTTDPAPIVEPCPIVTPGRMTVFAPIQQSSSMKTGCPNSTPLRRERTLGSWLAAMMLTFDAIWTRSPMTTRLVSRTVSLRILANSKRGVFVQGIATHRLKDNITHAVK